MSDERFESGPAAGYPGASGNPKVLVVIFGPPAVGKMTVGRALAEHTGLPLVHNHVTVEPLLQLFPYGHPIFRRLTAEFRTRIFEEIVQAPEYGGLIFTYVWALDEAGDKAFVDMLTEIFTSRGERVCYVELSAPLDERLRRNTTESRLAEKPSKRDLEASRARLLENERDYRMNTQPGETFFYPDAYLRLDVAEMEPGEAAKRIAMRFGLAERTTPEKGA